MSTTNIHTAPNPDREAEDAASKNWASTWAPRQGSDAPNMAELEEDARLDNYVKVENDRRGIGHQALSTAVDTQHLITENATPDQPR